MKQKKASYSLEFKLQAVHLVKESGQSMAEVARSLGVPKSTRFEWVRERDKERDEENGLLRPGRQQAFALVDAEKANYSVQMMCGALDVSRSGYYARCRRGPSNREKQDKRLVTHIKAIHAQSRQTYGSPGCTKTSSPRVSRSA